MCVAVLRALLLAFSAFGITVSDAEQSPSARRGGDSYREYAAHCWAPSSAFADPSCNCLGQAVHPKLGSRRTINVIVGGWYAHILAPYRLDRAQLDQRASLRIVRRLIRQGVRPRSKQAAPHPSRPARCLGRVAAAVDAFLLKIAIEEQLGYPVELIADGLLQGIDSTLNLTNSASVFSALAAGTADIYPEASRHTNEPSRPMYP